jgi:hypothetical protein
MYPGEIYMLARYRLEVAHGIMHTPEWDAEMAGLQRRWDEQCPQAEGRVPAGPIERADTPWV